MRPIIPTLEQVHQLPQTHEVTVSDEWIDVMGHMNVAYYTAMFSTAMLNFRSSLGLDNDTVRKEHIGAFAIETHTRYLNESRIGDELQVHTRVLGRSKSQKRFHAMHFALNREQQVVSATFEVVVANVDLKERRMTQILPDVLVRMDAVIVEHSALGWAAPVCGTLSVG